MLHTIILPDIWILYFLKVMLLFLSSQWCIKLKIKDFSRTFQKFDFIFLFSGFDSCENDININRLVFLPRQGEEVALELKQMFGERAAFRI